MHEKIAAPWTPAQVEALNTYQEHAHFHPYTCGRRGDGQHGHLWGDTGTLVATVRGWACLFCGYTQDWAWAMSAAPCAEVLCSVRLLKNAIISIGD